MQQMFVEMYNYKQKWIELSVPEREAFMRTLASALGELQAAGVEVLAYAVNDPATDHRAPYDFFCVYGVPEIGLQRTVEAGIATSGWYEYFDQVNLSGAARTPIGTLVKNPLLQPALPQGKPIIAPKRSAKKSTVVDGHVMTHCERGEGTPVVFIHRAIAVDLIGAGDSDKLPASGAGTYNFETHAHYLEGLLENLDLGDDVILVGHDWGSNLAFDWAIKHEDRVRAIPFTEALLPPNRGKAFPLPISNMSRD